MIGVFVEDVRCGSIVHFPKLTKPCWVAYADDAAQSRKSFKTRKEAAEWLAERAAVASHDGGTP
jgi:hypothetical protein